MAVVHVESLLKPLSEENPCGENLRWDRRYLEVERLAEGKEETQFSAAEEPDWREVRDGCAELFARGKHLRVAVLMTLAALRQALVYRTFLDHIEPDERVYHRQDVPFWLRRALLEAATASHD